LFKKSGDCLQVFKMDFGVTGIKAKKGVLYVTSTIGTDYCVRAVNPAVSFFFFVDDCFSVFLSLSCFRELKLSI